MTPLQRELLELLAGWADQHPCLQGVYLFGSAARDEMRPTSDIDIAVKFVADINLNDDLVDDYMRLQATYDAWAKTLGSRFGHVVHMHRINWGQEEDDAWPAIQRAAQEPVGALRKAAIVATPARRS